MNQPLVITGPSGVGKTFLMDYLCDNYKFDNVLSTMTRQPREGELTMVDNEYISDETYDFVEKEGDFFMSNKIFTTRYAYRRSFVKNIFHEGKIPTAIVYISVVDQWFKEYPESLGIFLKPINLELIKNRIKQRESDPEIIARRIDNLEKEIELFDSYSKYFKKVFEIEDDKSIYKAVDFIKDYYNI
ncbi:MAG: hypothetical protein WCJ19_05540 [bacterium]